MMTSDKENKNRRQNRPERLRQRLPPSIAEKHQVAPKAEEANEAQEKELVSLHPLTTL